MNSQQETIKSMINSPDHESRYMAVQILRNDSVYFTEKFKKTMLGKMSLEDRIRDYSDICEELIEKKLTLEDFIQFPEVLRKRLLACAKLDQIKRLVNGKWTADFKDPNQDKWYPYFEFRKGLGLVFLASHGPRGAFRGAVALFKDQETSDFVGTTFVDLYKDLE